MFISCLKDVETRAQVLYIAWLLFALHEEQADKKASHFKEVRHPTLWPWDIRREKALKLSLVFFIA